MKPLSMKPLFIKDLAMKNAALKAFATNSPPVRHDPGATIAGETP